jgi:hypothetical protein
MGVFSTILILENSKFGLIVFGKFHGKNKKADLSAAEEALLRDFEQLDTRDQEDVLGNVKMKLENAKKGTTSSSLGNA